LERMGGLVPPPPPPDSAMPAWQDYCPNAQTLIALDVLPWTSRREW
jgi:hypothetical protein